MTRVALGKAAVAINRFCNPWDIAAPYLLVEEAGGVVVGESGHCWRCDSTDILATNKRVHKEALKLFLINADNI